MPLGPPPWVDAAESRHRLEDGGYSLPRHRLTPVQLLAYGILVKLALTAALRVWIYATGPVFNIVPSPLRVFTAACGMVVVNLSLVTMSAAAGAPCPSAHVLTVAGLSLATHGAIMRWSSIAVVVFVSLPRAVLALLRSYKKLSRDLVEERFVVGVKLQNWGE